MSILGTYLENGKGHTAYKSCDRSWYNNPHSMLPRITMIDLKADFIENLKEFNFDFLIT